MKSKFLFMLPLILSLIPVSILSSKETVSQPWSLISRSLPKKADFVQERAFAKPFSAVLNVGCPTDPSNRSSKYLRCPEKRRR